MNIYIYDSVIRYVLQHFWSIQDTGGRESETEEREREPSRSVMNWGVIAAGTLVSSLSVWIKGCFEDLVLYLKRYWIWNSPCLPEGKRAIKYAIDEKKV